MPVSPPVPRLPSLNALRAFEAAARLGGFAQAAEELQVTPGAVAAQIKSLEEEVGDTLFDRHARGVRLTALGQQAMPAFIAVFDQLAMAVRDLRREAAPRKIHIAALPALAQLWLAPRLPLLRSRLPDIDVSVTALETPPNLKRVPFDLCLFYREETSEYVTNFGEEVVLPVCSPDKARALQTPEDLKGAICLIDTVWAEDWQTWADVALPGERFTPHGPIFSLYALAVQEALNGAGVLMAHHSLVAEELARGCLVAPFEICVPLRQRISLWSLPQTRERQAVSQVIDALRAIGPSLSAT